MPKSKTTRVLQIVQLVFTFVMTFVLMRNQASPIEIATVVAWGLLTGMWGVSIGFDEAGR